MGMRENEKADFPNHFYSPMLFPFSFFFRRRFTQECKIHVVGFSFWGCGEEGFVLVHLWYIGVLHFLLSTFLFLNDSQIEKNGEKESLGRSRKERREL